MRGDNHSKSVRQHPGSCFPRECGFVLSTQQLCRVDVKKIYVCSSSTCWAKGSLKFKAPSLFEDCASPEALCMIVT